MLSQTKIYILTNWSHGNGWYIAVRVYLSFKKAWTTTIKPTFERQPTFRGPLYGGGMDTYRGWEVVMLYLASSWSIRPAIHLAVRTLLSSLDRGSLNGKRNHLLCWMFPMKLFYSFLLSFIPGRIEFTNWEQEMRGSATVQILIKCASSQYPLHIYMYLLVGPRTTFLWTKLYNSFLTFKQWIYFMHLNTIYENNAFYKPNSMQRFNMKKQPLFHIFLLPGPSPHMQFLLVLLFFCHFPSTLLY